MLFKREFETAQSINTNLAKGLSPAEAVKAATAKKDEKVEQKDRDETAEGKGTKEQDKEDEEKKDGAWLLNPKDLSSYCKYTYMLRQRL